MDEDSKRWYWLTIGIAGVVMDSVIGLDVLR